MKKQRVAKPAKTLSRRKFVGGLVAGGVAAATANPAHAIAGEKIYHWKMAMTWQKALPGLGTGALRLADRITKLSGGRLLVKAYGGGEIVPPQGVFDAVAQGTVEMGHTAPYYWLNKTRAASFFCAVPGGLTAQEMAGWIYFGGGQQLWDELYAGFGLKSFAAGSTGTQMGGWYNRELKTVNDLKGLKIRMPGLAGEVITKMGASSQTIPPQELFTAMQSGVIDALEWVGPWNDMSLGFHRVSKYYYGPAFHEGGPQLELMVNKKAYETLPKDLQHVIKVACAVENAAMLAEYHANNIQAFEVLKKREKVDIRLFPEEILREFFKISAEVVAEVGGESALSRKIYDSYSAYRRASMDMTPFTELGFLKARNE